MIPDGGWVSIRRLALIMKGIAEQGRGDKEKEDLSWQMARLTKQKKIISDPYSLA